MFVWCRACTLGTHRVYAYRLGRVDDDEDDADNDE